MHVCTFVCVHVCLYMHSNLCLHCIVHYTVWDLGGQTSIRPYWRCYYSNTDAIIYVVDSADRDRLAISKSELVSMLEVSSYCAHVHMAGLMIMASHRTFSSQKSICAAKVNLARQIYYTLSMEISLSLLKIINAQTNFGPYHKYWYVCMYACMYSMLVL